ncbi:hypothetical protein GmHk_09G025176 [Glycine max]|nr:hypothetical protein GmHk_09G025176 [Glycine max]
MVKVMCLFMHRRWKNTLKLRFLSQKIQEYRRVFIYAEKVEEHIRAAIFISKNPRVQDDVVGCFKYYAKLAGELLIAAVFLENLWNFDLVLFFILGFDFDFL